MGYSPWGRKESDMTERLHFTLSDKKGASLVAQMVKNLPAMQESCWVGKIPCRREWLPTPVFLPGKSHEQRSLAGYNPWDRKFDTT